MNYKEPLIFVTGVAIGSVATWLVVKEKYKAKMLDEVESVKETYKRINKEAIEKAAAAKNKPDISVYAEALKQSREKEEATSEPEPGPDEPEQEATAEPDGIDESNKNDEDYIYEITPTDFGSSLNGHTKVTIYYFLDDVYADEMYERIDPKVYLNNPLVLIGSNMIVDPIDYIRRMPKDEICIRNYSKSLDINIATEPMTYASYIST